MRVIPVIDLRGGFVVRGVAGRRQEYRPVKSEIAGDATPAAVARAFAERFGFSLAYVADLDAIGGASPDKVAWQQILQAGLQLLVDAGVSDTARLDTLLQFAADNAAVQGIVLGLESIPGPEALGTMVARTGAQQSIFSLDLRAGTPICSAHAWTTDSPTTIASMAIDRGVRRMIVLDLAAVGIGQGPSVLELCAELRCRYPHIELIAGGGLRNINDLQRFHDAGCDAVLVATALHDGSIREEELNIEFRTGNSKRLFRKSATDPSGRGD